MLVVAGTLVDVGCALGEAARARGAGMSSAAVREPRRRVRFISFSVRE
jgi:hypothetical protein